MATPSLYEMLTFSFSGELPLEQVSERDQLIRKRQRSTVLTFIYW